MTDTITTTNLSVNITGLEDYVEYNISVRAYTSVGPGPYSDPVTVRTSEDGINLPYLSCMQGKVYIIIIYGLCMQK